MATPIGLTRRALLEEGAHQEIAFPHGQTPTATLVSTRRRNDALPDYTALSEQKQRSTRNKEVAIALHFLFVNHKTAK